ncbi:hypothetical protein BDZ89DRAFT_1144756 [Hymenopellis radicata]|nr:hypothetical protein BDZ89DRAFT_1144756 [Hymenopellis radicata]
MTHHFAHGSSSKTFKPYKKGRPDTREHAKSTSPHGQQRNGSGNKFNKSSQRTELSEKEKEELRAAGKCLRCKEPGHMARQCPQGKFVSGGKGNSPLGIQISGVKLDMESLRQMAKGSQSIVLNSVQFDESLFTDDISSPLISLDWDYMTPDSDLPYWDPIRRVLQEYGIDLLEILQQNLWTPDGFQPVLPDTFTTDTLVVILSHITEEASTSDGHGETHRDDSHLPSEFLEVRRFLEGYLNRDQFFRDLTNEINNLRELTELESRQDASDSENEDTNSDSDYDMPDVLDGSDSEDEEDSPKQHTPVEDIQEDVLEQLRRFPLGRTVLVLRTVMVRLKYLKLPRSSEPIQATRTRRLSRSYLKTIHPGSRDEESGGTGGSTFASLDCLTTRHQVLLVIYFPTQQNTTSTAVHLTQAKRNQYR